MEGITLPLSSKISPRESSSSFTLVNVAFTAFVLLLVVVGLVPVPPQPPTPPVQQQRPAVVPGAVSVLLLLLLLFRVAPVVMVVVMVVVVVVVVVTTTAVAAVAAGRLVLQGSLRALGRALPAARADRRRAGVLGVNGVPVRASLVLLGIFARGEHVKGRGGIRVFLRGRYFFLREGGR